MIKIIYPDYIPNWSGSRGRLYPSNTDILKTNPQVKKMSREEVKKLQRHHVDLDRMNRDPNNIHLLDSDTHEQVHKQERALSSALIKAGIVGYDKQNPHYFVKDDYVRRVLKEFFKP